MSITHGLCSSYRLELLLGIHDWDTDSFKIALYSDDAVLGPSTTVYTATGEITSSGYTAGGQTLVLASGFPQLNPSAAPDAAVGTVALIDFDDADFDILTADIAGALIYNTSKSNRAVAVLSFGVELPVDGEFSIVWPTPDAQNAILRV